MKQLLLCWCCLFGALPIFGQGSILPLDNPAYHILDRLEILTGVPTPFHSNLKPYNRRDVAAYALAFDTAQVSLGLNNRYDLFYIYRDNNEWLAPSVLPTRVSGPREPISTYEGMTQVEASFENTHYTLSKRPFLKHFYKTPANLFELNDRYFHLRINPLLNFSMAAAQNNPQPVFYNQRGIAVRGGIDDRIYFTFDILESQARFPNYVNERIAETRAIPGQGLFKPYRSRIFDIDQGYDYLNGQGHVGFNVTPHVGVQFGYGRNFIGNGYRSLLLSDYANNYLYLKLNWKVGPFHYQNLFGELLSGTSRSERGDELIPKKYAALHYLSFNITPDLNIGLFESVVFSRENNFEFHYLLPFMLYRTLEQGLGSPDNVMIGLTAKANLFRRFQLYGQVALDELKFFELFVERRGWWGNKVGLQMGMKYINVLGIDHLDAQVEYNIVRPYTYTHRDSTSNYVHTNQPLAHPLGANFREWIFQLRHQPTRRVEIIGRMISADFGEDDSESNNGGNLLLPNAFARSNFGNTVGQGIATSTLLLGLDISYQLRHNVYLDLTYFYRNKDSAEAARDLRTQYVGGGIRVNLGRPRLDF